jgi:hypothetical protein
LYHLSQLRLKVVSQQGKYSRYLFARLKSYLSRASGQQQFLTLA